VHGSILHLFTAFDHLLHGTDMFVSYTKMCLAEVVLPGRLPGVARELSVSERRATSVQKKKKARAIELWDKVE
jgi:hypothetical protein